MAVFNGPASAIEDNRLKVQIIDENSTEEQYPSAIATYKAVKDLRDYSDKTFGTNKNIFANALKGNASGNIVALKDVSPLQHDVNIQLKSDTFDTETITEYVKIGTDESDSYNWADVAPDNIFKVSLSKSTDALKVSGIIKSVAVAPIIDGQIELGENAEVYWIDYSSDDSVWYLNAEFSITDGVLNWRCSIDDDGDVENGVWEGGSGSYETAIGENQKITGIAIKTVDPENSWVSFSAEALINKDVPVKVCGKNLFKIVSNTVSGVSVSLNKNGEAVLNGTATQSNNFVTTAYIEGGTYTLSSKADKIPTSARQAFISVYNIADKTTNAVIYNYEASDKKATTELASGKYQFRIRIEGGVTYDNYTFRPQLELGNVATDYEPYIEPTTYTADENGELAIPSIYPSMTIVADSDATMLVEYNRDINKAEFGGSADLNNYYTKNEIDGLVGDIETLLGGI